MEKIILITTLPETAKLENIKIKCSLSLFDEIIFFNPIACSQNKKPTADEILMALKNVNNRKNACNKIHILNNKQNNINQPKNDNVCMLSTMLSYSVRHFATKQNHFLVFAGCPYITFNDSLISFLKSFSHGVQEAEKSVFFLQAISDEKQKGIQEVTFAQKGPNLIRCPNIFFFRLSCLFERFFRSQYVLKELAVDVNQFQTVPRLCSVLLHNNFNVHCPTYNVCCTHLCNFYNNYGDNCNYKKKTNERDRESSFQLRLNKEEWKTPSESLIDEKKRTPEFLLKIPTNDKESKVKKEIQRVDNNPFQHEILNRLKTNFKNYDSNEYLTSDSLLFLEDNFSSVTCTTCTNIMEIDKFKYVSFCVNSRKNSKYRLLRIPSFLIQSCIITTTNTKNDHDRPKLLCTLSNHLQTRLFTNDLSLPNKLKKICFELSLLSRVFLSRPDLFQDEIDNLLSNDNHMTEETTWVTSVYKLIKNHSWTLFSNDSYCYLKQYNKLTSVLKLKMSRPQSISFFEFSRIPFICSPGIEIKSIMLMGKKKIYDTNKNSIDWVVIASEMNLPSVYSDTPGLIFRLEVDKTNQQLKFTEISIQITLHQKAIQSYKYNRYPKKLVPWRFSEEEHLIVSLGVPNNELTDVATVQKMMLEINSHLETYNSSNNYSSSNCSSSKPNCINKEIRKDEDETKDGGDLIESRNQIYDLFRTSDVDISENQLQNFINVQKTFFLGNRSFWRTLGTRSEFSRNQKKTLNVATFGNHTLHGLPRKTGTSLIVCVRNRTRNLIESLSSWLACPELNEIIIIDWRSKQTTTKTKTKSGTPNSSNQIDQIEQVYDPVFKTCSSFCQCLQSYTQRQEKLKVRIVTVENLLEEMNREKTLSLFPRSFIQNFGFVISEYSQFLKTDADVLLKPDFFPTMPLTESLFYAGEERLARNNNERYLHGTIFVSAKNFANTYGYDERLTEYGWDDSDLYGRLKELGLAFEVIDFNLCMHQEHTDQLRSESIYLSPTRKDNFNAVEEHMMKDVVQDNICTYSTKVNKLKLRDDKIPWSEYESDQLERFITRYEDRNNKRTKVILSEVVIDHIRF